MINTTIIYNKIKHILERNNILLACVICMNVDYWSHSYCDVVRCLLLLSLLLSQNWYQRLEEGLNDIFFAVDFIYGDPKTI